MKGFAFSGFLLSLALPLVALAQEPPAAPEPPPEIVFGEVFEVEMVMVPVTVRSRQGFLRNIERGDFRLLVDGRPTTIESFESGSDAPVSVIVLQDLSGSMAHEGKIEASRRAMGCLTDRAHGGDEIALATFAAGQTRVEVPFTADLSPLRESAAIWDPYGTTGLYDAVSWLPEISLGSQRTKRAAVLITDGADNASRLDPAEARRIVQEAELPVYVLGLAPERPRTPGDPGEYREENLLRALAANTGGRYYSVNEPPEVDTACTAILEELRHQYVLGFSAAGYGPERDHAIEVEVTGGRKVRRAQVIHRRGYRGTRPSTWEGSV